MKNMSKTTKSSLITYGLVVLAYVVAEIFMKTGHMTSLLKGLLVPLCVYAILAVSLNLTVGILGELSLGHAGFMCVGAFTSAVFTKCMMHTITVPTVRFLLALLVGVVCAGICGVLIGIPVLRLRGDYLCKFSSVRCDPQVPPGYGGIHDQAGDSSGCVLPGCPVSWIPSE